MYFNTPNKRENYVDPSQTPGTTFVPSNTTYAPSNTTYAPTTRPPKTCSCGSGSGMMNFVMMLLIVGLVVLAFLSINDNIKVTSA